MAGPLGPAAQYDCQQLAAVQLSLRSADLHCSLSHRLLAAAAALKLCAFGVVTPGILSRDSSRRWRGGGAAVARLFSSGLFFCALQYCFKLQMAVNWVLQAKFLCTGSGDCCCRPNFFAQAAATVVAGRLLKGMTTSVSACLVSSHN